MRARAGEHNEADMGTKMVDLRRMTSLSMETALRPPMGWRSWVAMATLVTNAAAEDCRATTDLMNGEESRNGVETETSLVIALLKPRCEASTRKKKGTESYDMESSTKVLDRVVDTGVDGGPKALTWKVPCALVWAVDMGGWSATVN